MHSRMRTARFSGRLFGGVSAQGCVYPGGMSTQGVCPPIGGVCPGVSAWGSVCHPPPVDRHACENITLPQTWFADGKNFERRGNFQMKCNICLVVWTRMSQILFDSLGNGWIATSVLVVTEWLFLTEFVTSRTQFIINDKFPCAVTEMLFCCCCSPTHVVFCLMSLCHEEIFRFFKCFCCTCYES